MVTCQSSNQLQTPAKVSWAFKMVSQFGSLGYTIMRKTADLTVVQKTIIDTLHKEGKPQTFITKEAGCSQTAVSKHVNRKLSGRKKCGRKRCTTNRENRSLMRIVKQNKFKNLGELHKEWTEDGVKASRATAHRRFEEFGYSCRQRRLTWAKEKKNCWTILIHHGTAPVRFVRDEGERKELRASTSFLRAVGALGLGKWNNSRGSRLMGNIPTGSDSWAILSAPPVK